MCPHPTFTIQIIHFVSQKFILKNETEALKHFKSETKTKPSKHNLNKTQMQIDTKIQRQ